MKNAAVLDATGAAFVRNGLPEGSPDRFRAHGGALHIEQVAPESLRRVQALILLTVRGSWRASGSDVGNVSRSVSRSDVGKTSGALTLGTYPAFAQAERPSLRREREQQWRARHGGVPIRR
eukprot:9469322-Pyramimonas_sp.AAC.2